MEIRKLDKNEYKGYPINVKYFTDRYYDVIKRRRSNQFIIKLKVKKFPQIIEKTFTDSLFEDYYENPEAYGIFIQNDLLGIIEVNVEWNKRLRITNIYIDEKYRHLGYGTMLMNFIFKRAQELNCRALVLETQSCNINAINLYCKCGFDVIGLDTICYSNEDIENKEVRLEMGKIL